MTTADDGLGAMFAFIGIAALWVFVAAVIDVLSGWGFLPSIVISAVLLGGGAYAIYRYNEKK